MKKNKPCTQAILVAFLLASSLPLTSCTVYSSSEISANDPDVYHYSPSTDYAYSSSHTIDYADGGDHDYGYYLHTPDKTTRTYQYDTSGRKFGNMNYYNGYYNTSYNPGDFTSGVSSYPGTSTGPGIDNGYNSTPSGIYNTIDPVTGSYRR